MGRTPREAATFIPRFKGTISLVTEASSIQFLEFKESAKREKYGEIPLAMTLDKMPQLVNIDDLTSDSDSAVDEPPLSKRTKNAKPYVHPLSS